MTSTLPQGPYGLVPVRSHAGGFAPRADAGYNIASNYNQTIFLGDPVVTTGTGRNIASASGGASTTTGNVRGVFKGVNYTDNFGNTVFSKIWVASTPVNSNFPIVALVYDDPSIIFKAQVGNGNLANTNLNDFYKMSGINAGSTLTGVSGGYVDFGTKATSTGAGTIIFALNLTQVPGNDYSGFTELEVMLARHELVYGTFVATGS